MNNLYKELCNSKIKNKININDNDNYIKNSYLYFYDKEFEKEILEPNYLHYLFKEKLK